MLSSILVLPVIFLSTTSGAAISPLTSIHQLLTRQTSGFDPNTAPSQCRSRCQLVTTTINSCKGSTDPLCGCSISVEGAFVDCLNCIVSLAPSTDLLNAEQFNVDRFVEACNIAGASLPSTTLSEITTSSTTSSTATSTTTSTTGTTTSTTTAPSSSRSSSTSSSSSAASASGTSAGSSTQNSAVRDNGNARKGMTVALAAAAGLMAFV